MGKKTMSYKTFNHKKLQNPYKMMRGVKINK